MDSPKFGSDRTWKILAALVIIGAITVCGLVVWGIATFILSL